MSASPTRDAAPRTYSAVRVCGAECQARETILEVVMSGCGASVESFEPRQSVTYLQGVAGQFCVPVCKAGIFEDIVGSLSHSYPELAW
jgi:hypothetical protein